jgi:hypothetical protein
LVSRWCMASLSNPAAGSSSTAGKLLGRWPSYGCPAQRRFLPRPPKQPNLLELGYSSAHASVLQSPKVSDVFGFTSVLSLKRRLIPRAAVVFRFARFGPEQQYSAPGALAAARLSDRWLTARSGTGEGIKALGCNCGTVASWTSAAMKNAPGDSRTACPRGHDPDRPPNWQYPGAARACNQVTEHCRSLMAKQATPVATSPMPSPRTVRIVRSLASACRKSRCFLVRFR